MGFGIWEEKYTTTTSNDWGNKYSFKDYNGFGIWELGIIKRNILSNMVWFGKKNGIVTVTMEIWGIGQNDILAIHMSVVWDRA